MSAYCTPSELSTRLGDDSTFAIYGEDAQTASTLMLSDLEAAQAEVDGFVGVRYIVPVANVGARALLAVWTLTLAEELAWGRVSDTPMSDALKARIERIRGHLEKVADGTLKLASAAEANGSSIAVVTAQKPQFNRNTLGGF